MAYVIPIKNFLVNSITRYSFITRERRKMMKSTIRLFKAVPINEKRKKSNKELSKTTIQCGYIFSPEVIYNYPNYDKLIQQVEEIYGIGAEELNSSFHKSWVKIKDTDMEQLVVEQIAHYLTTYGKEQPVEYLIEKEEQWGVAHLAEKIIDLGDFESDRTRDESYVYIPKEKLEIPNLDINNIKLVVIKGYTKKELRAKLLHLISLGVALGEDTMADVLDIAEFLELDEKDIIGVKNKEVKSALYDYLNLFPENPIEFLRYILFKLTGKTLLIKSLAVIEEIKTVKDRTISTLFSKYKTKYGLEKLAEIFYRFKPIFLAFKSNERLKPTINKIRKLATKYHKPMPEDYLNTITAKLKRREKIDRNKLESELDKVNTFRKIRLAYALKFRTKDVESILYRIRNGKGYATDFSFENKTGAKSILNIVLGSVIKDISKNVKDKKIYIPDYIHYSLPATEKQFTGNFPSGTYVTVPKDIIFGINWKNIRANVIDLDLSVISPTKGKIGWDSDYRTEGGNMLFSGDITDARGENGATELFYVRRQKKEALILYVNYYNFDEDIEVPFKIVVAQEQVSNFRKNYMVNPNNLMAITNSKINRKEKILGLVVTILGECRFYFTETYIGGSITSSHSIVAEHSRRYLFDFYENTINLKNILIKAGANLVENKEDCEIDLSPEELEKDSILKLLS